LLSIDTKDTSLSLEVWNANTIRDELIGKMEVPLSSIQQWSGQRGWQNLDPIGRIDCTVSYISIQSSNPLMRRPGRNLEGLGQGSDKGVGAAAVVITCYEASQLKDVQLLGKQSPYVNFSSLPSRMSMVSTDPCRGGNTNPKWSPSMNRYLFLSVAPQDEKITLEVLNCNSLLRDELICTGQLELSCSLKAGMAQSTAGAGTLEAMVPLKTASGAEAGELKIGLSYFDSVRHPELFATLLRGETAREGQQALIRVYGAKPAAPFPATTERGGNGGSSGEADAPGGGAADNTELERADSVTLADISKLKAPSSSSWTTATLEGLESTLESNHSPTVSLSSIPPCTNQQPMSAEAAEAAKRLLEEGDFYVSVVPIPSSVRQVIYAVLLYYFLLKTRSSLSCARSLDSPSLLLHSQPHHGHIVCVPSAAKPQTNNQQTK
jgi:hypothetical protein